ncbi:MAG TPA: phosphoribosylformylglycinamidine synthase subunit PurS [Acidimicrobiales bacterium]|nr:phosphoribosylformylglycinamidine synthase subunit PurS [Acidimicrobiales bacterium]
MRFSVLVEVTHREGVADPEGATIERALPALGFGGVSRVRVGKAIRFELEADSEEAARREVEEMCRRLLANPVIEQASSSVVAAPGPASRAEGGRA